MASPMPVLPLVASITVCPGLSSPDCSAASRTPSASRSLTEPSGLKASILTKILTPCGASLLIRTTGVWPTVSRMFLNLLIRLPCSDALLGIQCIKNTLSPQSPGRRRLHCARGNRMGRAWEATASAPASLCGKPPGWRAGRMDGTRRNPSIGRASRSARSGRRLLLTRVVLGIDVGDVERTDAVDLHDRFGFGPGVVRHAGRQVNEARRRQHFQ